MRLRALFPNPQNLLLPGLYVRATINEGIDPHGILVPQNAVGHNQKGEPTALVVDAKNFARLRLLKTGRAIDNNWQVLEGLKPGEKTQLASCLITLPKDKYKEIKFYQAILYESDLPTK